MNGASSARSPRCARCEPPACPPVCMLRCADRQMAHAGTVRCMTLHSRRHVPAEPLACRLLPAAPTRRALSNISLQGTLPASWDCNEASRCGLSNLQALWLVSVLMHLGGAALVARQHAQRSPCLLRHSTHHACSSTATMLPPPINPSLPHLASHSPLRLAGWQQPLWLHPAQLGCSPCRLGSCVRPARQPVALCASASGLPIQACAGICCPAASCRPRCAACASSLQGSAVPARLCRHACT